MLEFNEENHQYTLDGKQLISVTQLMQKHGLAPSYAGVSTDVLNAKAERGSLIHKEIEEWIKHDEIGFTTELLNFKNFIRDNKIKVLESELKLHNDIVAGTCDLLLLANGVTYIADIKTTYTLHHESVSWQLSIYLYLWLTMQKKSLSNYDDIYGQAFHFDKEGNLNVVHIPLKPIEEVEKLMDCERKGEIYNQQISILNVDLTEVKRLEELIKYCDEQKKKAEEQSRSLKEILLQEMESRGLKTFEKDGLKITYVAPSTRSTIDSTRLKKEHPEIVEEYSKTSEVKASLKITLKEN